MHYNVNASCFTFKTESIQLIVIVMSVFLPFFNPLNSNPTKWSNFFTATLLKVTLHHRCFPRFLNCGNGTKSRNASHMYLHFEMIRKRWLYISSVRKLSSVRFFFSCRP